MFPCRVGAFEAQAVRLWSLIIKSGNRKENVGKENRREVIFFSDIFFSGRRSRI
jgi:hypothetical protein